MSDEVSTEVIRRVYDDKEGVYIEIGPDADGGGMIEIRTTGKSAEYYGATRLLLSVTAAKALISALSDAVTDAAK